MDLESGNAASMAGSGAFIMIVEDDVRLAELTAEYLEKQGFGTQVVHHGNEAVSRIMEDSPDVLILDIMLPGQDGFSICREIRAQYNGWILMLTAREDDMDQIVGLEIGADDYLVKPVHPRLLLARIRNLIRRGPRSDTDDQDSVELTFGGLTINAQARSVSLHGDDISLTTNEFDLLLLLARNAGRILSRDKLLRDLRGIDYDGIDRSIDVRISRLRKKLNDFEGEPRRLKTVRSQGYLFVPDAWS